MFSFLKKPWIPKVGELVICLDDRGWNGCTSIRLVHGKVYKVKQLIKCCGYSIDIDGRFITESDHTYCPDCKSYLSGEGIHWASLKRFRKPTEEEASSYKEEESIEEKSIQQQIDELLKEERYEEAAKKRDLLLN